MVGALTPVMSDSRTTPAHADGAMGSRSPAGAGIEVDRPQSNASFADRLTSLVRRIIPHAHDAANIARLSGGASQETWSFRAKGESVDRALILRRQPPGIDIIGKIGLETEAALMRAAATANVPSPHVVHILRESDGLGSGFVMDHVEGETLARRILRDEIFAQARGHLATQCGEILARIHAIPPGLLPPLPESSAMAEIADLHATYKADGQPRPVFELAFRWLRDHAPPAPAAPALVHGDFRNGNFIVAASGIVAVLDWELAHLGDPLRDLGWLCTSAWRFGEIDKTVGGFGTREDLIAGYESAGGARVDPAVLKFWETMGSLRWGVICLSMRARAASGDRPLERSMIGRRASENEIDLLRLLAPRGQD